MAKTYKNRKGEERIMPSYNEALECMDDNQGWCLTCAGTQSAEPDARRYTCEECGNPTVYGIEELALMGLIDGQVQPDRKPGPRA